MSGHHAPQVGDHVIVRGDFNATCGTVASVEPDCSVILRDRHDLFGSVQGLGRAPAWAVHPFDGPPRRLNVFEALA